MISALLNAEGMSQSKLAREAGVSQSSVSRAISGHPIRNGKAQARLFTYMHEKEEPAGLQTAIAAVRETWDGSAAHAEALTQLIVVSRQLWPDLRKERIDDGA